ncbi:MAG: ABC transporter permease [Gemmatimonadota bacterium]|nr:ABC transporter permease [Gemmatimonadota bacterium]
MMRWWPRATFARVGIIMLAAMVLCALLIPALAPVDPRAIGDVLALRLLPPFSVDIAGHRHLLGTDKFGRDVLARMMLAGRVSLLVGVIGSVLAAGVGVIIGASSAWLGGVPDRAFTALGDALLAVPRLILLLVCAALWRPGTGMVVGVLVATGWMGVARVMRAETLGVTARPFIESATALGVRPMRILWRHVLPNALAPAIVATTLGVGSAILLESGLSFLGLGVQPPQPSWGNMLADGRDSIVTAPWIALSPGIALIATVLACTLLGDALRDRLAGEQALPLRDRA